MGARISPALDLVEQQLEHVPFVAGEQELAAPVVAVEDVEELRRSCFSQHRPGGVARGGAAGVVLRQKLTQQATRLDIDPDLLPIFGQGLAPGLGSGETAPAHCRSQARMNAAPASAIVVE